MHTIFQFVIRFQRISEDVWIIGAPRNEPEMAEQSVQVSAYSGFRAVLESLSGELEDNQELGWKPRAIVGHTGRSLQENSKPGVQQRPSDRPPRSELQQLPQHPTPTVPATPGAQCALSGEEKALSFQPSEFLAVAPPQKTDPQEKEQTVY